MADTAQKLANPAPLGLVAFGLTTILLSLINAGVLPKTGESVVIPLAIAYGGTIQILVGLLEFKAGNTWPRDLEGTVNSPAAVSQCRYRHSVF